MLTSSTPELTVPELADLIQQAHLQCKALPTTGLLHARNAGEWLLAAKAVLSEEQWQTWLTTDCQLWENTAQTYMAIAKSWPSLDKPHVTLKLESPRLSETAEPSEPIAVEEEAKAEPDSAPLEAEVENPGILSLYIPGAIVPKARPRVTANGTFMPKRYQEWRNRAEGEIILQLAQKYPDWHFPLEKVIVEVHLIGKHRTNADGDNIVGSCLDALVAAGAIKNDNLSCIPEIYFKFVPQGSQGVELVLIPLEEAS
ncbi:MAG: RusA family crossover junction endodeoxyribonuclease [Desertifilum sp. SIO1I2]|nr:RusA family crossover junction endodeoxyribonuclease [Desertifilum sp. SIO1I2]